MNNFSALTNKPTFSFGQPQPAASGLSSTGLSSGLSTGPSTGLSTGLSTGQATTFAGLSLPSATTPLNTGLSSGFGGGLSTGTTVNQPPVTFTAYPFHYIKQCYDPNNANYRFRTYFYNPVPNGNQQAQRPALIDDRLFQQALADNPDPKGLCPVWANGFGDLQQRAQWQDEQMAAQRGKEEELQTRINRLVRQQDLDLSAEVSSIQRQHLKLTGRLIAIVRALERARRAGQALTPGEEDLRLRLQSLLAQLHQAPLEANLLKSMAFQLQILKEAGCLDALQKARSQAISDQHTVEAIEGALNQQQDALKGLVETIQRDLKDLDTIHFGYQIN